MQIANQINIKLLGMGDARYRRIRQLLREVLLQSFEGVKLEEIMDLDRILRYPVAAVPAIMINDRIIFDHGEIPDKNSMEALLRDAIANP
jgi:hypothetical protein